MKVTAIVTFTILLLANLVASSSSDGFHYVIQTLPKFETKYGAFRFTETDDRVSLEATSHALFLSTLLGLNNQIDTTAVAGFLQSIRNPDHGYAQLPGYASDLESVKQAVFAFQRLGQPVPDSANVAAYIQSLLHKDSNLFGNRYGDHGDIKSTAYAFQILHSLGLEPQYLKAVANSAQRYLQDNLETRGYRHFNFAEFGPISGNFYGILLGSYSGYNFGDVEMWASYIASFQSKDGGFYADAEKTIVSLEATANALASIHILTSLSKNHINLMQKINVDKLVSYVQHIPRNLKQASLAHLINTIARPTNEFQSSIEYETRETNGIMGPAVVQGTHIKPVVATSNPALSVEVAISAGSTTKNLKLKWKNNQYASDEFFDSSDLFGEVKFVYTIRSYALESGVIEAVVTDTKHIGYNIAVTSQVSLGGKSIHEGDNIGNGAQCSFSLALNTITQPEITSGDFIVVFTVLDSSFLPIHTQSINGKANSQPFKFAHTLDSTNIPTGDVICRFEVKNANGVHSVRDVVYKYEVQMIATEILFKGFSNKAPVFKLGETVEVSFVPATLPLNSAVQHFTTEAAQRHFEIDIKTPGGVSLHRVKGVPQQHDGKTRYFFKIPVTASLDAVGTKIISFAYIAASGESFTLANFNAATNTLLETSSLTFSVDAQLFVTDLQEKPNNQNFYYGELVTIKFKVKDAISGKLISGDSEVSNVYLDLKHQSGHRTFVSAHQPATSDGDAFTVAWFINPNAIGGAGILALSVQDADGNSVPLLKEGSKEEFGLNIDIEGDIEVDSSVKTTSHADAKETAMVAHFNLKYKNQLLNGAQLRAFVLYAGESHEEVLLQTSVATNEAGYEVSFSLHHEWVRTGEYKIRVYREADKFRDDVEPLFQISQRLEASENALPVRTEFVILVVFVSAFAALNAQKSQY